MLTFLLASKIHEIDGDSVLKDVLETTCELVTRSLPIEVGDVQAELVLVLNNYRLHLHNYLHVDSWNTYPTCLFTVNRLTPRTPAFCEYFELLTITKSRANTTCDFERG